MAKSSPRDGPGEVLGCAVCGQRLPGPGRCPNRWCGWGDRGFSVVFATGALEGALRLALHRYKQCGERWWSDVFAASLARHLDEHPSWFEEFDLLTGVPAYRGPGARRPWDPVEEVVRRLEPLLGPGWETVHGAVVKTAETPAMRGLGWSARRGVATGPLRRSLRVPEPALVDGARVLLVDDVMTEGSTLREVALALVGAGAVEVAGLVVARPSWEGRPSHRDHPAPVG